MSKHEKCKDCNGWGKRVVDKTDSYGRPFTTEIKCTTCHGTGWVEKNKNSRNDVVVLGK